MRPIVSIWKSGKVKTVTFSDIGAAPLCDFRVRLDKVNKYSKSACPDHLHKRFIRNSNRRGPVVKGVEHISTIVLVKI